MFFLFHIRFHLIIVRLEREWMRDNKYEDWLTYIKHWHDDGKVEAVQHGDKGNVVRHEKWEEIQFWRKISFIRAVCAFDFNTQPSLRWKI